VSSPWRLWFSDTHCGGVFATLRGEEAFRAGKALRAASGGCPRAGVVGDWVEGGVPRSLEAVVADSEAFALGLVDASPVDDLAVVDGNHGPRLWRADDGAARLLLGRASARVRGVSVHRDYHAETVAGGVKVLALHGHYLDGLHRGATAGDRARQRVVSAVTGVGWAPGSVTGASSLDELEDLEGFWLDLCFGNSGTFSSAARKELYFALEELKGRGRSCHSCADAEGLGTVGTVDAEAPPPDVGAARWLLDLVEADAAARGLGPGWGRPGLLLKGHTHWGGRFEVGGVKGEPAIPGIDLGGWETDAFAKVPCSQAALVMDDGSAVQFAYRHLAGHVEAVAAAGRRDLRF